MTYPADFQTKLERAIVSFETSNKEKPCLIQISETDFNALLPRHEETFRFGLRIKGVTTIGLADIPSGEYFMIT